LHTWRRYVVDVTYGVDECLDVLDAEAERDDHGDAKDTIECDAPHHSSWQLDRCILHLLTHVSSGIRTNKTPDGRCQTDEGAKTLRAEATTIIELGEDFVCWSMIRHGPEDDKERKETQNMREKNDSFGKRQMVGAPDVESNDEEGEGEHEQCDLPLG
jgi:hypothetical protein